MMRLQDPKQTKEDAAGDAAGDDAGSGSDAVTG